MGKQEVGVRVRMIVDASGRQTFLGIQEKLKIRDTVFDQYAIHTWFEGYDRSISQRKEGQDNYIYIHFLPISNSWVWQIPITESITSIGVVTQKKNFAKSKESREAVVLAVRRQPARIGRRAAQGKTNASAQGGRRL